MSDATKVWIVDDDESIRWVLEKALQRVGMDVQSFPGAAELLDALQEDTPDVLICDIRMPGVNGLELMERVHSAKPDLPVIIVTAHSDLDAAVAAFKGGAFEYLPKPFDVDGVATLVQRAAAKRVAVIAAPQAADRPAIIGAAPAMQDVFRAIGRLAASQITVLITGESGTGKELIARAIHRSSQRPSGPFVPVNCAALPETILEAELFGYERGAFTGAVQRHDGRFLQADGGTLFLDEIGEIPTHVQVKLLRVLQEGEVERLGGRTTKVDLRLVSATNQDLRLAVKEGRFREDLYYRLNVIALRVPPLRERRDDIPLLAEHFLRLYCERNGRQLSGFTRPAAEALMRYEWPG
ncbi:MAG: sigma-54-dependent transcriptional regulator, partial [Nevskiales bacterium]